MKRLLLIVCCAATLRATAQTVFPLTPDRWTLAGDSLRFEPFLGRPSLFLGEGMVTANGVDLRDGTIEFDMATSQGMRFLGLVFRERSIDEFESIFFRPGASGTVESVQYQPNLLGSGTWEIFHGDGFNASADFPRDQWIHVRVEIGGSVARLFLRDDPKPVLTVPRLALDSKSGAIGFWTGPFGNGAYFSNVKYTVDAQAHAAAAPPALAPGTIADWELSSAIDASSLQPGELPDLGRMSWQRVHAEPWKSYGADAMGLVLINRYRRGPNVNPPPETDAVMNGRVPRSQVVFARAVIDSDRAQFRRMHFGYSDGAVIFVNGKPLFFGMNPYPFRDLGGVMEERGEAVYLPLQKGRNQIVIAVTEFFGGWGFWTRLDPAR